MANIKRILCFSAGLDSFILKSVLHFEDEECLFIDMGTKENQIEKEFIKKHFPGVIYTSLNLIEHELPNKIIPYRNHHLALQAANYGNEITFAFTAGDTTKDKDYVFKSQMEGILNYFSQNPDKVKIPGPFSIEMPFKDMTKTEMVALYLKRKFSPDDLLFKSSSCYEGGEIPCGVCRSCLRKYVALELNGIDTTNYFEENPLKSLSLFYNESLQKNRLSELKDIEKCLTLKLQ